MSGMSALTAKNRASLALTGSTALPPEQVLELIKSATGEVKGSAMNALVGGLQNVGARVHVEVERPGTLEMSVNAVSRVAELCTFMASASPSGERTEVKIGPLGRYKTTQSKAYGLIPTGPKMIAGYEPYKTFLKTVADKINAADGTAAITVAQVGG